MGILYFEAVARIAFRLAPPMAGARRAHQRAGNPGLGRHRPDILAGAHGRGRREMKGAAA
jgi:hypothetical protein